MLPPVILASSSPRRRVLLARANVEFSVMVRDTTELNEADLPPRELCLRNARAKAFAVFQERPGATVIGADTLVFLDDEPLGKPADKEEAVQMLRRLSGRTHAVCTAVSLQSPLGVKELAPVTEVAFKRLSDETISRYLELVNVLDKAGAYALQEHGNMLVDAVRGDADNVVGLPVQDVLSCLRDWGYTFP